MIQATVGETWGSTVQQGCVDAMKSTPDQFSLHSHIRTTLQTLCLTFSWLLSVSHRLRVWGATPSSCHRMSLSSSLPSPVCSVGCLSDACPFLSSSSVGRLSDACPLLSSSSSSESSSSSLSSFSSFLVVSTTMN